MDKRNKTFFDRLRDMAQGGGTPAPLKRTVYGTSDSKAYQLSDGMLYRVRRDHK